MDFRIATQSDTASIAALHADSWRRTYRGMMLDAFLDGPILSNRLEAWGQRLDSDRVDQWVGIALENDNLVGFICVFGDENEAWGSYIDNLHVSAEYHRRGVGSGLMLRAAEWLDQRHQHSGVYLWAMEANGSARKFYEQLGGQNYEIVMKTDPGGGCAPNCRYVWSSPTAIHDSMVGSNGHLADLNQPWRGGR